MATRYAVAGFKRSVVVRQSFVSRSAVVWQSFGNNSHHHTPPTAQRLNFFWLEPRGRCGSVTVVGRSVAVAGRSLGGRWAHAQLSRKVQRSSTIWENLWSLDGRWTVVGVKRQGVTGPSNKFD